MKRFLYLMLIAAMIAGCSQAAEASVTVNDDGTREGEAVYLDFVGNNVTFADGTATISSSPLSADLATDAGTTKVALMPISYIGATEIRAGGIGQGNLCVGLSAGADEIGTAEGHSQLSDAADFLRFSFPVGALFYDGGLAADFTLALDLSEVGAGVQVDLEVRVFENTNLTPIWAGFIAITDNAAAGWSDLTMSGTNTSLDKDDVLMVEVTAVADTDDCDVSGARLTYRPGIDI